MFCFSCRSGLLLRSLGKGNEKRSSCVIFEPLRLGSSAFCLASPQGLNKGAGRELKRPSPLPLQDVVIVQIEAVSDTCCPNDVTSVQEYVLIIRCTRQKGDDTVPFYGILHLTHVGLRSGYALLASICVS